MTLPPLLAIAAGVKARPRKAPLIREKEIVLHMQVAALLRQCARPEWFWCHVPNGEVRDARTAAKLKQMGVKRGMTDFILWPWETREVHFLELKRAGARLTEDQSNLQVECITRGGAFSVVDDFNQAVAILRHWNAIIEVHT